MIPLAEATADTCGAKAATLGVLLRAGLPVPDGFVVPFALRGAFAEPSLDVALVGAIERALAGLGDPPVAVRSSAADEDTDGASAAGQYDSRLAVRGVTDVVAAVRDCLASLHSPRATAYRTMVEGRGGRSDPAMAVLVQRHLDAEVSGVLFTPGRPDEPALIESSWGLGPSVVAGSVTPDAYRVHADGTVTWDVADKRTRLDRGESGLRAREVPADARRAQTLDEATANELARLGSEAAAILGASQDVEWALADGRLWLLQARPITVRPPEGRPVETSSAVAVLTGAPGSHGVATGTARIVRGPMHFDRVRPGDILICPFTDPAWTPLLRIAAGVVTETGGALSHAAIVAREQRIPAVLGVPRATSDVLDGTEVTIDGTAGTVTAASRRQPW